MPSKDQKTKGKLIHHSTDNKYTNDGKVKSTEEKIVHHSEDGYFAKYFKKSGSTVTKVEVKSSGTGGEYTVIVISGGDKSTSTYSKSDLVSYLKGQDHLQFILDYVVGAKSLARAKKTKSKSKSKSKTGSKSGSKKVKKASTKKPATKKAPAKKKKAPAKKKAKGKK